MTVRVRPLVVFCAALLLLLVGLLPPIDGRAQPAEWSLRKVGHVAHPPIDEMSGIVKSRRYENVWWVHNDSGDGPRLFAIDSTGSVHVPPWRQGRFSAGASVDTSDDPPWPGLHLGGAAHIDYEDLALRDSTLYVGDIGNNGNARRDLGIYVVPEPFYHTRRTRPKKYIRFAYPEQETFPAQRWHYDAEALFVVDGRLYLLTKYRRGQQIDSSKPGTTLYRLDTEHPHRVNALTVVDEHDTIPVPTAAALSPSGDRLAVLGYNTLWLFPRPADGVHWLSTEPRRLQLPADRLQQAEAVTWDDPRTLRITNEQRDLFLVTLARRSSE